MSMLRYFFERPIPKTSGSGGEGQVRENNSHLFEGLAIMDAGEEYLKHLGKYPVIFLTLKAGKQPNWEMAYASLIDEISREFKRHINVFNTNKLAKSDQKMFQKIMDKEADQIGFAKSLQFLSICLEQCYGEKAIILIDEYDVPLENAYFQGFYDEMIGFIRSLFESALKSNESLAFSAMTGCLRISKESIFTGLNNLEIISIRNPYYAEHFGFTPNEVEAMFGYYGIAERMDSVRKWYDGYLFGEKEVYNPWSTIKFAKALYRDIHAFAEPYWSNTSGNSIIRNLIEKADLTTKAEIEELIGGRTIEKPIHEDITYGDIYKSMDNLWNFLFFTGYLKKVSERQDDRAIYVTMRIPNEEVLYIYENQIADWFREQVASKDMSKMYEGIMSGDEETFERELSELLVTSISYMDSYENFYHRFVLGSLAGMRDYLVRSNRESGDGRSDICIKSPNARKPAAIIEIKAAGNSEELSGACGKGLQQITDKGYDQELRAEGYRNIYCYGLAFFRKQCRVKCEKSILAEES